MEPPITDRSADDVSGRVIAAAVELLEAGGISRSALPNIATRAGIDPAVIEAVWPDRQHVLMAAWTDRLGWQGRVADTGSLREDLSAFGQSLLQSVGTPEGRNLFRSSLPIDDAEDLADVRTRFWQSQFDAAAAMTIRAARRGDLRREIDPLDAIRMFCSAVYFDTLYLDGPAPPGYITSLVDIFLEGVARQPLQDFEEMRRQVWEALGDGPRDELHRSQPAPNYTQATSAQIRQAILDAVIAETTVRGPELVTRSGIARRVGVPVPIVERMWISDADLLLDAGARARQRTRPLPDTGRLWEDLLAFTDAKAKLIATRDTRAHFLKAVVRNPSARNAEIMTEFWAAGLRESTQMCIRARERGELRDGVDPDHATRILVVSLFYDLFFADAAMRPDYAVVALDLFFNGAAALRSA